VIHPSNNSEKAAKFENTIKKYPVYILHMPEVHHLPHAQTNPS